MIQMLYHYICMMRPRRLYIISDRRLTFPQPVSGFP